MMHIKSGNGNTMKRNSGYGMFMMIRWTFTLGLMWVGGGKWCRRKYHWWRVGSHVVLVRQQRGGVADIHSTCSVGCRPVLEE
jgi:hypothetical protein